MHSFYGFNLSSKYGQFWIKKKEKKIANGNAKLPGFKTVVRKPITAGLHLMTTHQPADPEFNISFVSLNADHPLEDGLLEHVCVTNTGPSLSPSSKVLLGQQQMDRLHSD